MYWGREIPDPYLKFRGTAICAGFIHWMISYAEGMAWYSIRYADGTQICNTFLYKDENDMINAKHKMEDYIGWTTTSWDWIRIKLNYWCRKEPDFAPLGMDSDIITPSKPSKNIGVTFDSTRSLSSRIGLIFKSVFFFVWGTLREEFGNTYLLRQLQPSVVPLSYICLKWIIVI